MGLFDKIKDILFVEEEELPVITKKEEEPKEQKVKNIEKEETVEPVLSRTRSIKRDIEPQNEVEYKKPEPKPVEKTSSPFLAFDEEEFERMNNFRSNKPIKKPTPPVDNYIKTTTTTIKKVEHKDYSRYEMKKVTEKKPFRPSPVISPVYGILDKNYKKEDVVDRAKDEKDLVRDVDSIRKKAFGFNEIPVIDEELLPKKNAEKSIDDLILDNFSDNEIISTPSEKKTVQIDDFLFASKIDKDDKIEKTIEEEEIIPIENEKTAIDPIAEMLKEDDEIEEIKPVDEYQYVDEHTSALEILDEIEKELNKDKQQETLEGDLFNLIDSMYEERKDE